MGRSRRIEEFISRSADETLLFGEILGKRASPNTVFCLFGNLASGKTTLIKGIARGAAGVQLENVTSPTFVYLNIYDHGSCPIYHFDLYRLAHHDEFVSAGLEEFLFSGGIACIEWSERIEAIIPKDAIHIHLEHIGLESRQIDVFIPNI